MKQLTAAPMVPTEDPAAAAARLATEERERQRVGQGRASTILTGPLGDTSTQGTSATRTLLG
ncbi:MAG: hypothetical protein RL477_4 [Pseudomonadota bacterium]